MGFTADVTQWFSNEINKEPQGGTASWVILGLGIAYTLFGVLGLVLEGSSDASKHVLLGLAFVSLGAAERVPSEEIRTASALRMFAWSAALAFVAWNVGPPLLAAGVEMQLVVLALLPIAVGYVLLLYKVLTN